MEVLTDERLRELQQETYTEVGMASNMLLRYGFGSSAALVALSFLIFELPGIYAIGACLLIGAAHLAYRERFKKRLKAPEKIRSYKVLPTQIMADITNDEECKEFGIDISKDDYNAYLELGMRVITLRKYESFLSKLVSIAGYGSLLLFISS